MIRLLISRGANINIVNEFGEIPLVMASLMSDREAEEAITVDKAVVVIPSNVGANANERWVDFKNIQELNFSQ